MHTVFLLVGALILMILILNRWQNFGLAMFVGALFLALFGGFGWEETARVFVEKLTDLSTIQLIVVVTLINLMGYVMKKNRLFGETGRQYAGAAKRYSFSSDGHPGCHRHAAGDGRCSHVRSFGSGGGEKGGLVCGETSGSQRSFSAFVVCDLSSTPLILAKDLSGFGWAY